MDTLTVEELIVYLRESGCTETNAIEVRFMTGPKGKRAFIYTDLSKLRFNHLFYQRTYLEEE